MGSTIEISLCEFFETLQSYADAVGVVLDEGPLDFRATSTIGDVEDVVVALRGRKK